MAARDLCHKTLLLSVCIAIFSSDSARSQTAPTTFQRSLTYFSAIEELDTKFEGLRAAGTKLIAERQDAFNRLVETKKAVAQLAEANAMKSLELAFTQLMTLSKQAELNGLLATPTQNAPVDTGVDVRNTPRVQLQSQVTARKKTEIGRDVLREYGNDLAQAKVRTDFVLHQIKTINVAGKLALERHVSILQELEKIVNEMLLWNSKTLELFDMYWSLADVAGVKSDIELKAGLRQLNRSSNENAGALLLKSITLIRLQEYDEAIAILNQLANVPALQVLVTTIYAEVLARTGDQREALAELRKTARFGLNDPKLRMHRAIAFAACDELKFAESEWEALLKIGGHEVAARRAIAFINAASKSPSERTKSKAMENAQLAVKLDDADWASRLALALATFANGETEQSSKLATEAAELATGSNQSLCDEIAEQLLAGNGTSWKFN